MNTVRTAVTIITPSGNLDVEAVLDSMIEKSCISLALFDRIFGKISGLAGRIIENGIAGESYASTMYTIHAVWLEYWLDGIVFSGEFLVRKGLEEDMVLKEDRGPGSRSPPPDRKFSAAEGKNKITGRI